VIDAELAYAFTLGMVATVNPCGFAMLPAYLSYFLGLEGSTSQRASVVRALGVGLVVTAGFVTVFGLIGLGITQLSLSIERQLPWVTMVIGVGLMVLGIAMLRGFELSVRLPKVQMGTGSREMWSMFLFGISYAVASLSCTIGIFLPVMTRAFESSDLLSGMAAFIAYAAGMGVVLSAITITMSLARGGLVHGLRRAQPYIGRISGALLVIAGAYLTYYGWWESRVLADPRNPPPGGPVDLVTDASDTVRRWITDIGAERIGIVLVVLIAVAVVLAVGLRGSREDEATTHEDQARQ
jgi:cytochrome c biogenesis protein CcdA